MTLTQRAALEMALADMVSFEAGTGGLYRGEFAESITAFRDALAEQTAEQVPETQGWQPIETAPKDGTVVDLWHEEFGREADCYWGLPHHCCGEMGSLCDSDWHDLEPGWVGTFNEIMSPASAYTHWMPLPEAPNAASEAPQPAKRAPVIITGPCGQCKSHQDPCPCGNVNTGAAHGTAGEAH